MHEGPSPSSDEPQPKRQRVLACRRCRHRKQKCEEERPCSNCQRSGEECIPTEPASRSHVIPEYAVPEYVKALEDRIAELESGVVQPGPPSPPSMTSTRRRRSTIVASTGVLDISPNSRELIRSANNAAIDTQRWRNDSSVSVDASTRANYNLPTDEMPDHTTPAPIGTPIGSARQLTRAHHTSHPLSSEMVNEREPQSAAEYILFGLEPTSSAHNDNPNGLGPEASLLADNSPGNLSQCSQSFARTHLPLEIEALLLKTYQQLAQARYPFLHWPTFSSWQAEWKASSASEPAQHPWQGFFVNLVYATALLLLSWPRIGALDAPVFYENALRLFKCVLDEEDPILGAQARLLLGLHALHGSSTQRLLSLTSSAMRYCVQNMFHLAEDEPKALSPASRLDIQLRRRCFWSAYGMDRTVMASFGIPQCIPDSMITVKLYANIDDEDLLAAVEESSFDSELPDSLHYTCVSSSLHILQCRRIQSEISQYTLSREYPTQHRDSLDWRVRILAELENYKSRAQSFSDPRSKGPTSQRWLAMIYHYSLLMLYRPTKDSVLGPAGDWSIQASTQACLIFRKCQMDRETAPSWMGVLVQFQSGVTLLYCFWATPPEFRTDNYDSPDVPDALRACSNILALMADRWPRAECLRDVFELLAREVPLIDRPTRPPTRISQSSVESIRQNLAQLRALVVHTAILRMIEEMINEDFPRVGGANAPTQPTALPPRTLLATRAHALDTTPPSGFELPFNAQQHLYNIGENDVQLPSVSEDELLAFPGIFNINQWT